MEISHTRAKPGNAKTGIFLLWREKRDATRMSEKSDVFNP
jgi:hypothetical protein